MVGFDELRVLFQPKQICDSMDEVRPMLGAVQTQKDNPALKTNDIQNK